MRWALLALVLGCDPPPARPDAAPLDSPSTSANEPRPGEHRGHGYTVTLPSGWRAAPGTHPDTTVYASADGKAQLTVSVHFLAPEPLRQGAERLLEHLQQAERTLGPVQQDDPVVTEQGGVVAARYQSSDPPWRGNTLLLARPSLSIVFYLETPDLPQAGHEALARAAFNSIELR